MKILIVNTYDRIGGAARGSFNLYNGLKNLDLKPKMVVKKKTINDSNIFCVNENLYKKISDSLKRRTEKYIAKKNGIDSSGFNIGKFSSHNIIDYINSFNSDIVHLQWINDTFIGINDLYKIKAPLVWTMRDMWPFSYGGYHYDYKYKILNQDNMIKSIKIDMNNKLNKKIHLQKMRSYAKIKNLTTVGISKWISDSAIDSKIFGNHKVLYIPNAIDRKKFKPIDWKKCREDLDLPKDKKLILFGAINSTNDIRKGYPFIEKILEKKFDGCDFVIFGNKDSKLIGKNKIHYFGRINDDSYLAKLYSACDLFINPSLLDAHGKVSSESLACNVPVVAFNSSGMKETIKHKVSGFLAKPYSLSDFITGIGWCLQNFDKETKNNICRRESRKNDSINVAQSYYNLYKEILANS